MKTTICKTCNTAIRNCNIKKHELKCTGIYTPWVRLSACKWCCIPFDDTIDVQNHSRWCIKNPLAATYRENATGAQLQTVNSIASRVVGIKQAHLDGKYKAAQAAQKGKPGTPHTDHSKELIRQKALASPHRRLVRSIRNYIKKDGSIVKLDSSWEEALAHSLDNQDIDWIRPGPIKWVDDDGIFHNYFPDFYLTKYDLYLDPKGPYALKQQEHKILCLTQQLKNLIIITTLDECINFKLTER